MDLKILLALFRHLTIMSIEKGEIILQNGKAHREVYFIRKGLVRAYYTNEEGEEITFQLFPEYHVFGSFYSLLFDEPSRFTFQALERTKFYKVDFDSFHNVIQHSTVVNLNKLGVGKMAMKQAFQRVESLVLLTPEERYLKYMQDYPNVINRVPDKYIAHVLGITPVSLSRIKGRITSKRQN